MSPEDKRHKRFETFETSDGLAILAELLVDMLVGADRDRSRDALEDLTIEVDGLSSSQNLPGPGQ